MGAGDRRVPVAATRRGPATGWSRATGRGHGAASRQRPTVSSQLALSRSEGSQCACHRPGGAWEAGRGASRAPYRSSKCCRLLIVAGPGSPGSRVIGHDGGHGWGGGVSNGRGSARYGSPLAAPVVADGRRRWRGYLASGGVPADRPVVDRTRRRGVARPGDLPAWVLGRSRARHAHRFVAPHPAAELGRRLCRAGLALSPLRRGVLLRSARWPVGYSQPRPDPVAVELAARDRVIVGAAGGPARSDSLRRLPVGPARVQPG